MSINLFFFWVGGGGELLLPFLSTLSQWRKARFKNVFLDMFYLLVKNGDTIIFFLRCSRKNEILEKADYERW